MNERRKNKKNKTITRQERLHTRQIVREAMKPDAMKNDMIALKSIRKEHWQKQSKINKKEPGGVSGEQSEPRQSGASIYEALLCAANNPDPTNRSHHDNLPACQTLKLKTKNHLHIQSTSNPRQVSLGMLIPGALL